MGSHVGQSQLSQGDEGQMPGSLSDHGGRSTDAGGTSSATREPRQPPSDSGDTIKHKPGNRCDGGGRGSNGGSSSTLELPPEAMKALRAQQAVRRAAFERQRQQVLPFRFAFRQKQSGPCIIMLLYITKTILEFIRGHHHNAPALNSQAG